MDWYESSESESSEEAMGCCYDVGYGSMMVECCQNMSAVHEEGKMMVAESMCATEKRRGGETRFEAGKGCDEFEWYESTESSESDEPRICCKALTASCMACGKGIEVDEFCAIKGNENYAGCPRMCCKALTASCMACSKGVSVDEFCAMEGNDKIAGCDQKPAACQVLDEAACKKNKKCKGTTSRKGKFVCKG